MLNKITVNHQIHLTKVLESDHTNLIQYLTDEQIFSNTLTIPYPYTERDAQLFTTRCREKEKQYGFNPNWAIRNQDNELIGGIGHFLNSGADGHKDEIGYWIARPYWGKGLMTETVKIFSEYLFDNFTFVRLEALVFHYNPASAKVLQKAGYEKEGILKKYTLKNNEPLDIIVYAKIKS